ncbi:MAG: EamA family transporter [Candidatus Moraniibacteriota bacterium]
MELLKIIFDSWQFNLAMSLVFSVLLIQFYKLAVKETQCEGASTIILQLVAGISVLFFVPFFSFRFPNDLWIYLLLLLATIFYAINDRMQTTVRKNLDVSVYTILNQLSKVFMVLYGITLFHEPVVMNKLVGGGLILLGNVLLFYRKGKLKFNKNVILSVTASFFMATALMIDVGISKQFNLPFYVMLTLIIPGGFIFLTGRHSLGEISKEFKSNRQKYYIITGISWGLLLLFSIRALQAAEIIFIAPLLATSVLLNVLVASVMHKEKSGLAKKIIAAVIVILGIFVMVY